MRIPSLAFLIVLAMLFACSPGGDSGTARNFVLISIDNLGAHHLGCYGYEREISPFMDSLAEGGVLFENVTAQETWTLPSHASMLSSRYTGAHGVWNIEKKLPIEKLTLLQETFRAGGFRTAGFASCEPRPHSACERMRTSSPTPPALLPHANSPSCSASSPHAATANVDASKQTRIQLPELIALGSSRICARPSRKLESLRCLSASST